MNSRKQAFTFTLLLRKAVRDSWGLLLGSAALLFGFGWLYVWLISVVDLSAASELMETLPPLFRRISSIPISKFANPTVMLSVFYVHPIVMLTTNTAIATR